MEEIDPREAGDVSLNRKLDDDADLFPEKLDDRLEDLDSHMDPNKKIPSFKKSKGKGRAI